MDFQQRLERAVQRGERTRRAREHEEEQKALSEEECRRLHGDYRLKLTEHIEKCVANLGDQFPGFEFETVMSDRGWGAACNRDDVGAAGGRRDSFFSRLEMVVRPLGKYPVIELAAKGTIRNKEVYNRQQYQPLDEVDLDSFVELIELWVLEYAELFAAAE
ncbi:MAG: hypothetical protein DWQ31_00380 [Planctomycetota bacterium]|nr:MAG: hypothetical protein DWQ31_00380 [Planctomycetota bacterium]REJ93235.1 MAG: hypothetical protein DWQ35_10795 [Planctomycetota bacterium]REK26027.1 MAG: hypothetical protein DWQ42_09835 [Planctomycetota bacterium]REK49445.1 MAG: hypothetical protein DWQ46_00430 [Planctomycetota bacterium]